MRYALNAYHYIALGCATVVLFIIIQYFSALLGFVRSTYRRRASRKHAVKRLRNLPRGKLLEPQPELPLPVAAEVEPIPERAEPFDLQPAVSTQVPLPVVALAEPIFERAEPPEIQPAVSTEVLLPIAADVEPILERVEPLEFQPAARTEVPLPVSAKARATLEHAGAQPAKHPKLPLQVGSKIWAVCKLGSIPKGTPGIITGVADGRFFWQSPTYLCTFADNRQVRARPNGIEVYNHAHSLQELEHPNLGAILSRRMTLRAQQLFSWQRSTHPPLAGNTVLDEIAEVNSEA